MGSRMTNVVNLRTIRKRAVRDKEAQSAAENRLAHGVSKSRRSAAKAERKLNRQKLDQHKIVPGDR